MGYQLSQAAFDRVLAQLGRDELLFAPTRVTGGGRFSETDLVRYAPVAASADIVFDEKSTFTFKEALLPISETLFYFTEEQVKQADPPAKGAIVFLRSCDLHAVRRLDDIYLNNGPEDSFYKRLRGRVRFALMGCPTAFDSCFCVDMGTNRSDDYAFSVDRTQGGYLIDCKDEALRPLLAAAAEATLDVTPAFVRETPTRVSIPDGLTAAVTKASMWDEYDTRCINCGRCNFSCPTCTCFTMQDMLYTENGKAGERRRVWASCMVDGFTDVAGGGSYRQKNGQRMRFKTLHKVLDYKQRFGVHMCVGCGRCDDVCPEYISFSHIINKLGDAMQEVTEHAAQ